MANLIANILKNEIGKDKDNNPLFEYKFVDLAGQLFTNFKLVSISEDEKTAILEDLSPQSEA
ncbi:hypothetical protein [uncultured Arcobacter sp.]|uniref:hypothetical protein n=1 Tax=uncultured Arcobacter sp. TaxID=165434 RepID=UPI0026091CDA|nr:hypothetical protein [uncultured Arcobacter sp.]